MTRVTPHINIQVLLFDTILIELKETRKALRNKKIGKLKKITKI